MPFKFNPFTGNFDQTGSGGGGGGASYIDGEVQNFSALPQTVGSPAVDSAYLVREAEGAWLISRKPAGIYIRTANTGTRASDWTYAGEFPDVFNDANFVLYDDADSTKNAKFQLSSISTGTTRTITVPNKNVTLDDAGDSRTPSSHAASHAAGTKATFNNQVAGMTSDVFIRANNAGTAGNSITLTFDGVDSITTVLGAWNSANPSNQATLVSGNGSQVPDNQEEFALSGGTDAGSDPISDPAFNSIGLGVAAPESAGQLVAIRTETGGQDSLLKAISTANTTSTDANWRGRIMNGAENRTFLMGCYLGEAGLGAHSWSSAKNESGAAWADFLVNPDGGADVFIGCQTWDKTKAILKVGNSDGKVTIADQASPTKKFNFDVSGVTAGQTRSLSVPNASGTLALTSDIPANTIASTIVDAKGDLIVATAADTVARLPVGATNGHVLTVDSAEAGGMKWAAASGGGSGGTKTYATFTATDNQPPATAFATLDTRNSIAVLDFDDTTDESAVFVGIMPEGASLGSGLKIRLHWMSTNQTSNNVVWDVSLERMNTDLDADSFATIASGTAAANGTSGILTVTEITLTTIDSVTAGDAFRLKVTRDANNASDNMSNDAELVAVEVRSAA